MYDLDMEQAGQATQQKQRRTRRTMQLMVVIGFVMFVASGFVVIFIMQSLSSSELLHFTGDHWQEVQGAPSELKRVVQVSPAGVVWVKTGGNGISCFDGMEWRHYQGEDYGVDSHLGGRFVLVGEEVWGITQDAVIRFDGQRWMAYLGVLASDESKAIVADESGVWVIDGKGNLTYFDGGKWSVANLRDLLPDVNWDNHSSADPTLAWTSDNGALWLALDGLWRFDGAAWREVRPGESRLEKARLVGQAGDRVWLWDGDYMWWVAADVSDWGRYTVADLGLPAKARVYQVVAQDGRLWTATSRGILTFDGEAWERLPSPGKDYMTSVALAPDGSVWAIRDVGLASSWSMGDMMGRLILCLAMGLGGVLVMLVASRRMT